MGKKGNTKQRKKGRPERVHEDVITTHINADFDGLASMLAAQKLYPDAVVIFLGSQEKNLRNFFINSMAYLFNMVKAESSGSALRHHYGE